MIDRGFSRAKCFSCGVAFKRLSKKEESCPVCGTEFRRKIKSSSRIVKYWKDVVHYDELPLHKQQEVYLDACENVLKELRQNGITKQTKNRTEKHSQ